APAGDSGRVVGIAYGAVRVIVAGVAVGELVQIRLAEHDRASLAQRVHEWRIGLRLKVFQRWSARGRRQIAGVHAVLDRYGQAVQGPELRAGMTPTVALARSGQHLLRAQPD